MVTDKKTENEIKLTVIATGFPTAGSKQEGDEQLNEWLSDALSGDDGSGLSRWWSSHAIWKRW